MSKLGTNRNPRQEAIPAEDSVSEQNRKRHSRPTSSSSALNVPKREGFVRHWAAEGDHVHRVDDLKEEGWAIVKNEKGETVVRNARQNERLVLMEINKKIYDDYLAGDQERIDKIDPVKQGLSEHDMRDNNMYLPMGRNKPIELESH